MPVDLTNLLDTKEAAAFLGILPHSVTDQVAKARLMPIKRGGRHWFTVEELDRYKRDSAWRPGGRGRRPKKLIPQNA